MAWLAAAGMALSAFQGNRAAKDAKYANQNAMNAQNQAAMRNAQMYAPYTQMGKAAVRQLGESGSFAGMNNDLGQIMQGGAYSNLVNESQRAADAQMSARGLRRSGAAIQQAAQIPTNVALGLEQEMRRRREMQAQLGLGAAGGQAGQNTMGAQAQAAGYLGNAQINAQRDQNYANLAGTALQGFGSGGWGSFGSGGGQATPGASAADYSGNAMRNWVSAQNSQPASGGQPWW